MKIKSISVEGINGSPGWIEIKFNDDLNIITGRNGSGKTTLLKLVWFCISGNIERALNEISFDSVIVVTTQYTLSIKRSVAKHKDFVDVSVSSSDDNQIYEKKELLERGEAVHRANEETIKLIDTSIFFPTFRRIEGGFSMGTGRRERIRRIVRGREEYHYFNDSSSGGIQGAIESHAAMLSVANHKFVSSISTFDIQQLVVKQHGLATNKVDNYAKNLSENIFEEIRAYKTKRVKKDSLELAISTLDKINQDVAEFEQVREGAFRSITVLSNIVSSIFKHKGIKFNPRVTLGDVDNSINSEALSAGEKQMLSFLCYNALYTDCPFFIDEPELSLHVDWQRILIDVMLEQNTGNQLFIATHSPFIYTQYEDKEIMIGIDRGVADE